MPLEVKWYDPEHTILIGTIAKNTIWDDYHKAIDQIVHEASQVSHRVDVIILDDVGMPVGNPMPHIKLGVSKLVKQDNIKLSIIAGSRGSSGFVRAVFEALGKMFMKSGTTNNQGFGGFTKTLDEAITRIKTDRAKTQSVV